MNEATAARVEEALKTLAVKGIYFNAEYELDDFWSVQGDAGPEANNWDSYLKRLDFWTLDKRHRRAICERVRKARGGGKKVKFMQPFWHQGCASCLF